jgi:RHH-type proline utilization regulon transcriptional repressor/proline dehydrogenase/delta 1-pyrroline-5-carboxylate dehydrogenase
MTAADTEARTRQLGREIFARIDRSGPVPLTKAWLDDRVMGVGTHDPALKVQLFRFVDTLPYLKTTDEITRHLAEYLHEAEAELPRWVRAGLRVMPRGGPLGALLAWAARTGARQMARRFIAGSNVPEVTAAVRGLRAHRLGFTIDLLGEATITEVEADHVQKQYLELLAGLTREAAGWPDDPVNDRDDRGPIPRVNVSVKLSALYSQFDPIDPDGTSRAVLRRLRPILTAARAGGAFVNFDMEQYAFKDTTLRVFRDVLTEPAFRDWPHVGIAMQAYLRDTEADLDALMRWARDDRRCRVTVRLVKGAYWDYETVIAAQNGWPVPVFTRKPESDASFERCTDFLLDHSDWLVPAFGSHNVRSMAHAVAAAEARGVDPRRFEFQMLYGMADPLRDAVRSLGHRVRIYTPYGQLLPGMAYLVRRLLENSSNDSFLKASFADGAAEEVLLMNPAEKSVSAGVSVSEEQNGPAKARGRPSPGFEVPHFKNEPPTDFAREENRRAMRDALVAVRQQLGRTYPAVVGGRALPVGNTIDRVNPSRTAELIGRTAAATAEDATAAVAAAQAAFDGWRDTPVEERAALLRRVANQFRRRRFELSAWIVLETGKPWREADADVAEAIDFCDFYAAEAIKLHRPHHRDVAGEDNTTFYEPRGVAVVIAPWNFPLAILTGMTAAALVTGNPAVMKPAEQSGVIAAKLMECFEAAGVPPGVVNYLPGEGEVVGPVLTNHPDVAIIAFTGSVKVGLLIQEQAARTPAGQAMVKRVIAEMGGKNAIIVDADADLDEAVKGAVDSAFGYAGQKCSAGSRAIVLDGIYDQFLARLVEATRSLTVAPADEPGASLGPVIDAEARDRIREAIARGKTEARPAYEADLGSLADQGYYVGPTVFADVPAGAWIAQEEIFGPVLAVTRATDLDDALRIANGTKYALTGGVYSRSPEHIAAVKRRFRVGNLYVNRKCTGALVDRQPFGGFKLSGIGSKAGGPDYLLQFVLPRTVTENQLRRGFAPEAGTGE